jgi:hypothetical protein
VVVVGHVFDDSGARLQAERVKALLGEQRGMISSTDLDGLLTVALLASVSDWRLDGFFDSRDSLWTSGQHPLGQDSHVFIDVHVALADWVSIDQHIVAADTQHAEQLRRSRNKINPNLARTTVFAEAGERGFIHKYPFGTFHYVLALLEASGLAVDLDLSRRITDDVSMMDLVLRADGAAENTRNYVSNTAEWWAWLRSVGGPLTDQIASAAEAAASSAQDLVDRKRRLLELFRGMGCSTSDANFSDSLKRDDERVSALISLFCDAFGVARGLKLGTLIHSTGDHVRVAPDSAERQHLLLRKDLFTYAFTSMRAGGFSATLLDLAAERRQGTN